MSNALKSIRPDSKRRTRVCCNATVECKPPPRRLPTSQQSLNPLTSPLFPLHHCPTPSPRGCQRALLASSLPPSLETISMSSARSNRAKFRLALPLLLEETSKADLRRVSTSIAFESTPASRSKLAHFAISPASASQRAPSEPTTRPLQPSGFALSSDPLRPGPAAQRPAGSRRRRRRLQKAKPSRTEQSRAEVETFASSPSLRLFTRHRKKRDGFRVPAPFLIIAPYASAYFTFMYPGTVCTSTQQWECELAFHSPFECRVGIAVCSRLTQPSPVPPSSRSPF